MTLASTLAGLKVFGSFNSEMTLSRIVLQTREMDFSKPAIQLNLSNFN
jgi:hypothetical protein